MHTYHNIYQEYYSMAHTHVANEPFDFKMCVEGLSILPEDPGTTL